MNRRDFLRVRTPQLVADPEITLLRFARTAMATVFEVLLPWGTPRAEIAGSAALDLIDHLESQLTVYRPSSEISRLNRIAARAPVPVEHRLFNLLSQAARITTETGGAFDITSGPLIKTWGFFRREGRVPAAADLAAAMENVGMRHVSLGGDKATVRYDRLGVEINLGSIGKGYALDRAAELLRTRFNIETGLLNGGNSSVLAIGTPPNESHGWSVGLRNPAYPEERLAVVHLHGGAMATSASTYQHFAYNDRKLGHLLDPRTGQPAEGMALAAAFAPSATEADALATAFYVLGPDAARQYCESHPTIGAVVLKDEPGAELEAINLPPGDMVPAPACIAPDESPWESA